VYEFCPHPQPLSPKWERGANSPVPLLPKWEKGLGDEGNPITIFLPNFYLKLTRMNNVVPLLIVCTIGNSPSFEF